MTDMSDRQNLLPALPAIGRYASTVLAVVCTLALRLVLDPILADRAPYMFFIFTLVVVTRLWGRGPAVLATALGGVAAWYFILEPRFSFTIANRVDVFNLISYFAVGSAISLLGSAPRRAPTLATQGWGIRKSRVVRHTVVLGGAAAVLAGMVILLAHDYRRIQDAEGWVVHTYRVINSAESLLSTMNDAELGQRDFLLTGDARYRVAYDTASADLPRAIKDLKNLTLDNPGQQARVIEIERLTGQRLTELNQGIAAGKHGEGGLPLAITRIGQGEPSLDELRFRLDAVMNEEHNLLGQRTAEAARRGSSERWVLGLGSAALIVLLVFANAVIDRDAVRRDEITQALSRHASLLEQAHDSLLTCRLRGAIEYWSRGAQTLFGYTREEAVGRNSHDLLQTSHPLGMEGIDAMLERDGKWDGELTQTTKDGRTLTIDAQWTLVAGADGNKTVLEANRDITEHKRAEDALQQHEYLLRESQRVGRIGSYDLDMASGCWSSSTVLDEIFGIGKDYARDVNGWLALIHPGQRQEMDAYFQEIISKGRRFERDYRIIRPSDEVTRWVSGKGELILDHQARPSRMIGTIQDITEQKLAEAAREESELRYRQLFERSESALSLHEMEFDAQGSPRDYRFVDVNPAFERMTGLIRGRIMGRNALDILPDLEAYWINLFGRVAATGEPAAFENYTRSLGRYYAGTAYSPRPNQFAVSFMDVTERKQAEQELHRLNVELEERVRARTAELVAANHELEAFAHSVSHDLRAPLRGIDGWSLALLEDCGERLDAKGRKYLDRVRSEAQQMGRLIDDLLHLSRVSRRELVPITVDLTSLVATVVGRLKEANPDRSIEFILEPKLTCTGDPRLLEIALTNLLNNAVKFTGNRPSARVEFGKAEFDGAPAFFVRDNGVGFDMAYAGLLFAPFQRLHKASEFPGTGIGLATVQRVIHRHGGRIWAQGKVGEGATIYFTLGAEKL